MLDKNSPRVAPSPRSRKRRRRRVRSAPRTCRPLTKQRTGRFPLRARASLSRSSSYLSALHAAAPLRPRRPRRPGRAICGAWERQRPRSKPRARCIVLHYAASPERAAPQPVRQLHHVCSERRGDLSIRTVKAHLLVLHILHGAHHPRAPWPLPVVCASLKGRGPLRSADPPVACNGRVVGQSRLNYRRLIPAATRNGA